MIHTYAHIPAINFLKHHFNSCIYLKYWFAWCLSFWSLAFGVQYIWIHTVALQWLTVWFLAHYLIPGDNNSPPYWMFVICLFNCFACIKSVFCLNKWRIRDIEELVTAWRYKIMKWWNQSPTSDSWPPQLVRLTVALNCLIVFKKCNYLTFFIDFRERKKGGRVKKREREKKYWLVVLFACAFTGWFLYMTLTTDQTCNLGASGWCSNILSYLARACLMVLK